MDQKGWHNDIYKNLQQACTSYSLTECAQGQSKFFVCVTIKEFNIHNMTILYPSYLHSSQKLTCRECTNSFLVSKDYFPAFFDHSLIFFKKKFWYCNLFWSKCIILTMHWRIWLLSTWPTKTASFPSDNFFFLPCQITRQNRRQK